MRSRRLLEFEGRKRERLKGYRVEGCEVGRLGAGRESKRSRETRGKKRSGSERAR
ncbi:hypothetical protein BDY24DRAFT_393374 [Mrakia frigida]|uniref:uncharacterized protein n=1 Tax=Mrakia frigida TaxID=29902 RepID=UPI003FCBFF0B